MRINSIYDADLQNGEGVGVTIGIIGCSQKCPGCFNQEAWNFYGGREYTKKEEENIINLLNRPYINHLSVIGGEPLMPQNVKELASLLRKVKSTFFTKKIWIWSGFYFDAIRRMAYDMNLNEGIYPIHTSWNWEQKMALRKILNLADILVDGPFIQEKKDITLKWRGSSNQRVIDLKSSLKDISNPKIVLYCN